MDILLFNQYYSSSRTYSQKIPAILPINLISLASYLKKQGMNCKIYELGLFEPGTMDLSGTGLRVRCGISDEEITKILLQEKPKIVGLGCMYSRHYIDILTLAALIKKVDPAIRIVAGGNHATAFYETVLSNQNIDFVVRGEGEVTFFELCEAILEGVRDFSSIKGLSYRQENNQAVRSTAARGLIENLDDLPMDYSLVDVRRYANVAYTTPFLMRYPAIGVITSRGCPGKCIYCTVKTVWGKTWRSKSAKRSVDEIEELAKIYGVREFSILDDSASLDKKRWSEICEEIINRKLDIRWSTPNGIAHWTLDRSILDKMKKAGCYRVTFGIESGNLETRKFLGKPFPLSQAAEMIRYANHIGMWTISTNILGFPYETQEAMEDTIDFAKKSGTDFATFFLLAPHVTSDVYSYFKKEGLIDFDEIFGGGELDLEKYELMNKMLDDDGTPTKFMTAQQLKEVQIHAYRSFLIYRALTFFNPMRILRKIHSWEDLTYLVKLAVIGLNILWRTFSRKRTKALLYNDQ